MIAPSGDELDFLLQGYDAGGIRSVRVVEDSGKGDKMSGNAGSSLIVEVEPDITASDLNVLIEDLAGTIGARDGGATIVLPSSKDQYRGRYNFTESIKIRQHIVLEGEGPGTLVSQDDRTPFTGDAILTNADQADRRFAVRNLAIDATDVIYGIHFNTPVVAGNEYADGIYTIENVEIFTPDLDGIWLEGRGQALVRGIRVRDAGRHGYMIDSVDSVFDALEAGGSGAAGLVVRDSNNRFSNCKFFYSGVATPTEGHGIWLAGPDPEEDPDAPQNLVFVNCETQDNNCHGVYVFNCHKVWLQNHISEGNNAGHDGAGNHNGDAYRIDHASDIKIQGTAIGRMDNDQHQKYAIRLENGVANLRAVLISQDNASGHIFNGYHYATDIRINNYDGNQDVAYTSSYTPDPTLGRKIFLGPLAGDITIHSPASTNYAVGNELEIAIMEDDNIFSVDTVTWGSQFRLGDFTPTHGANDVNVYTFRRLAEAWIQVSGMANINGAGLV
jgi:hypothetical protein